jgi:hypothetical protein
LLIERGQSPFEVTLSLELEWRNFDETSGETVSNYAPTVDSGTHA